MNSADKKVFRDPIHSLIEFDKNDDWGLLEVIQSSWFQRLRDVKQTGFVYYVYPSAHHTRFEHSLGACAMMKKVLDALPYPSSIGYELANGKLIKLNEKGIRRLLLFSALVHDIGHGPLSHSFERATGVNHEYVLGLVIENDLRELIDDYFSEVGANHFLVCDYFGRLQSKQYNEHAWLFELLSHHFDVDRLDYLLRDAYFTGVPFCAIDLPWILNNLVIKEVNDKYHLVIDVSKGTHTVEQFLYSRFNMYKQVYFHKTSRGFDLVLREFFKRAIDLFPEELKSFIYDPFTHYDFLKNFTDRHLFCTIESIVKQTDDGVVRTLGSAVINRVPPKLVRDKADKHNGLIIEDFVKINAYKNREEDLYCLYRGEVLPFLQISPFVGSIVYEGSRKYVIAV